MSHPPASRAAELKSSRRTTPCLTSVVCGLVPALGVFAAPAHADLAIHPAVRFHDSSANVFSANAAGTRLAVTVPSGAATGMMTITTPGGSVKTATNFTIN